MRQIASFASNRVVYVKSRRISRRSRRLRQIASLIASIALFASNHVVKSRRWIAPSNCVVGSRRKSRRWIASLDRAANRVVASRRWIALQIASLDRVVESRRSIASFRSRRQSRRTRRYIGLTVSGLLFSQFLSDRDDFYHFRIGSLNCSTCV